MKKWISVLLAALMVLTLGVGVLAAAETAPVKVALVLGTGGLGDKNFNDMAYEGLLQAEKDFGITFDYVDSESPSDFMPNYRTLCESGEYALIIGLGPDQAEAIKEISADFPEQKISHIDSSIDLPNVSGVQTKWQEQTFLTGVMAGLGTLSAMDKANPENVVGVILGMDNPALRRGVVGFAAGVKYVNPDCEVLEGVVDSFNDPGKGKEIALAMYNQGADFVQHIAGASGLGVFSAAKESNRYAFGVGGNQNRIEPDFIVATALRNVNEMVYNEVKAMMENTWAGGLHISGIMEGSVGYDATQSNVAVPQEIQDAIETIRQKIVNGELTPCGTADEMEAWLAANPYQK